MRFLAAVEIYDWSPGFHDPDPLDWAITLGYLAAAALCVWAWRRERSAYRRPMVPAFWLVLGVLFALLGFNKQLNLQTLLTGAGRQAAEERGWYEHRRQIQKLFVLVCGAAGLTAIAALAWWVRRAWRAYYPAVVGLAFAGLYAALRASYFNHVVNLREGRRHHPFSQEVLE